MVRSSRHKNNNTLRPFYTLSGQYNYQESVQVAFVPRLDSSGLYFEQRQLLRPVIDALVFECANSFMTKAHLCCMETMRSLLICPFVWIWSRRSSPVQHPGHGVIPKSWIAGAMLITQPILEWIKFNIVALTQRFSLGSRPTHFSDSYTSLGPLNHLVFDMSLFRATSDFHSFPNLVGIGLLLNLSKIGRASTQTSWNDFAPI